MNIQASGFQADRLAPDAANNVTTIEHSARKRLTMHWELRDGALVQVWRLAEATAAPRWRGPDAVKARRSARPRLAMRWQLRDDGTLAQVWSLAEAAAAPRWLEAGEARCLAA